VTASTCCYMSSSSWNPSQAGAVSRLRDGLSAKRAEAFLVVQEAPSVPFLLPLSGAPGSAPAGDDGDAPLPLSGTPGGDRLPLSGASGGAPRGTASYAEQVGLFAVLERALFGDDDVTAAGPQERRSLQNGHTHAHTGSTHTRKN
jgi:hypothetical protein